MSLERPTGKKRSGRRRNQRILVLRSIFLAVLIAGMLLLAFFVYRKIQESKIRNYYDSEAAYARILVAASDADRLAPVASDLCVIVEDSQESPAEFQAASGVVCPMGGGKAAFAKEAMKRMNPASTTKIMTALLALKYGNLTDQVTITEASVIDEPGASLAGIQPKETLSLEQLLYGLLLPSGNDAANAIAVHLAGSVEDFADQMNREAELLGAVDTHFVNPHGITDENHYTTAYDLYLITNAAMQYEKFSEICRTSSYTAEYLDAEGLAKSRTWTNSNRYVSGKAEIPVNLQVVGGKTGTTIAAGNCLVLVTEDAKHARYCNVILKSPNRDGLYTDMDYLLLHFNRG